MKFLFVLIIFLLFASISFSFEYADKVIVKKSERKIFLIKNNKIIKKYKISLGDSPKGHKVRSGDEKTPEGVYVLDWKNPNSKYFLSIHVSYPNSADKKKAESLGVNPGGDIFIHGSPNKYEWAEFVLSFFDWTNGCIAVKNRDMKEIWDNVKSGTPIEILP